MQVEPWFSQEVGKEFQKRENGGVLYYIIFGGDTIESLFLRLDVVNLCLLYKHVSIRVFLVLLFICVTMPVFYLKLLTRRIEIIFKTNGIGKVTCYFIIE